MEALRIGKCSRCKEFMTSEKFLAHTCETTTRIPIEKIEEIIVDHFYEIKSENGNPMIIAKGLNGVFYRLVCQPREFIPISTDFTQGNESTDKYTVPKIRQFKYDH